MVIIFATIATIFALELRPRRSTVRISDARFTRDLRRYQLAWRLIQHRARIGTIERWTGLSTYRIRTLYEAYATGALQEGRSPPRGLAPHQISFFWRSAHLKCEAAVLAGFLIAFGVCPGQAPAGPHERLETITRGEQLCRTYEEFKAYWPTAQSTLEHAILLLTELVRAEEIALAQCATCHVLIVFDRLSVGLPRCAYCAYEAQAGLPYRVAILKEPDPSPLPRAEEVTEDDPQGSLF